MKLSVYPVLNGIPQILYLTQQPRSCHRQAHGTDQERNDEQDQSILHRTGEQHQQGQNPDQGSCQTEHKLADQFYIKINPNP